MRKKQLYAILLAGTLAAGTVPSAVWAAEDAAAVSETTEGGANVPDGEVAGNPAQPEEQTQTADNTVTEAPAEPTETPAEPTQSPEGSAEPSQTPAVENTATETPVLQENTAASPQAEDLSAADDSETPDTAKDTGISITTISEDGSEMKNYYNSLQEAVDAVPAATGAEDEKATVIEITQQLALSNTVNVSGKKVCIKAAANISIGRGSDSSGTPLTGDMFAVSGTNSELQFATEDGFSMTVDGGTADSTGAIVHVTEGGAFGLFQGVTMTNNNSSAPGGAVTNEGGSIVLQGGTITGNKGEKGAVYTNNDIAVRGTVSVKDNNGANLYLDNNAAAVVMGEMTGSSVSLTAADAADQRVVLKAGTKDGEAMVSQDEFNAAVGQFVYDNQDFSIEIAEDGNSAFLQQQATVTGTPEVSTAPTATPTPVEEPSVTPAPDSFLEYHVDTLNWTDHKTFSIEMTTKNKCKWYYFFVDAGTSESDIQEMYDSDKAVNFQEANSTFSITVEDVPENETWLVVAAVPETGNVNMRILPLNDELYEDTNRPVQTPRSHEVSESVVSGLEKPLKFYPNTFYDFTVTGAGQTDSEPFIEGDQRWIPLYWSTAKNPTDSQKNFAWRIGTTTGIKKSATYNMYVFFKQQTYTDSEWVDTGKIDSVKTQFKSSQITDEEWNENIQSGDTNNSNTSTPSDKNESVQMSSYLSYQGRTIDWLDHNTVTLEMATSENCEYFCFYVKPNTEGDLIKNMYDQYADISSIYKADKNTKFTVTAKNVPEEDCWLIVIAKSESGYIDYCKFEINIPSFKKRRPPASSSDSSRGIRLYSVSESTVEGLENPLKFFPNTFYKFEVTGAGQYDKDAISGDERWIPQYWSTVREPRDNQKNYAWQIGSGSGIRQEATYDMYIFLKKQTYTGSKWRDTGIVESIKVQFSSAEITDEEWKENVPEDDDGYGTDGAEIGLVEPEGATFKDGASDTKSAVYTADPSPVGTMSALAALSLAAGGYILVRKRKKES